MRIVWRRREHLCTRCTAEYVKVNIREFWKTRQVLLYILYLCFWKRRWSYGASTFEMFENFRKISIDFRKFWKISYELLSIPTYFEVSRDWATWILSSRRVPVGTNFQKEIKEERAMQKCADLVDFEKCLKLMISCPRSALIQPRMNSGKSDVSWRRSGFQRSRHAGRRPRAQPN